MTGLLPCVFAVFLLFLGGRRGLALSSLAGPFGVLVEEAEALYRMIDEELFSVYIDRGVIGYARNLRPRILTKHLFAQTGGKTVFIIVDLVFSQQHQDDAEGDENQKNSSMGISMPF